MDLIRVNEMKIKVTEKHLKFGNKIEISDCPIALALKDAGFKDPLVGYKSISFVNEEGNIERLTLPKGAKTFVARVTNRIPVEIPFEFELNWRGPDES